MSLFETKLFEIRDGDDSLVVAMGVAIGTADATSLRELRLVEHAELGSRTILFGLLTPDGVTMPASAEGQLPTAPRLKLTHRHVVEHWDELRSGDLLDVRVIAGETDTPCSTALES